MKIIAKIWKQYKLRRYYASLPASWEDSLAQLQAVML